MSEWDEYADGWDDDPAVRAYAAAAFGSLQPILHGAGLALAGATVCDFGCGTGTLTEHLAARCGQIDAVDTSPAMLAAVRAKIDDHGWEHVRALDELPPAAPTYDLIVSSSVLAFVDDHPATVRELARHLRSGGLLVHWDWELDPDEDEPHGLIRQAAADALTAAGLVDVVVDTAFSIAVEGMVMSPLIGMGRQPCSGPSRRSTRSTRGTGCRSARRGRG